MKAMMKLQAQLEMVDSAMPFARARSGKISAPRSQGVGPQLITNPAVSAVRDIPEKEIEYLRSAKNEKIDADSGKDAVSGRNACAAKRERVGAVL